MVRGGGRITERVIDALRDQFEAGFLTESEFKSRLKELGLPEAAIEQQLKLGRLQRRRIEMEFKKDRILISWREGKIDRTKALSFLIDAGFDREAAERVIRLEEELAKIP